MTPKDLSAATITARLVIVDELLEDLDALGPLTGDDLRSRRLDRRALERILSQLVEVASDINQHVASTQSGHVASDYRESFDAAARAGLISADLATRLKPSVGLRNVVTHEYVNVDLDVLAAAAPMARQQYEEYRRSVASWLLAR